jgi:hypothetical protein
VTTIAFLVPLVWLAWLILTEWVPMFPLNDLESSTVRERALLALANYPLPLLVAAGVALHETWSLVAATCLVALTLVGHIVSWWLPYFGISFAAQREAYRREFLRTLKILPTEGHDVVIDVQHMVVGVLTLVMLGTTLAVTLTG